jgi:hypothetical protein
MDKGHPVTASMLGASLRQQFAQYQASIEPCGTKLGSGGKLRRRQLFSHVMSVEEGRGAF